MRWTWTAVIVAVAAVLTGVTGFVVGWAKGQEAMAVREVDAVRIAATVDGGTFFSEYREAVLIVTGDVERAETDRFRFSTPGWGGVWCDLAAQSGELEAGERVTVVTIGARAERSGETDLVLADCTVVEVRPAG